MAQEELAKAAGSLFLAVEASARLFGRLVSVWGGDKAKAEILGPLKEGRIIGALAVSESGGDEPSEGWQTKGRKEGSGYVLTGRKQMVANAPVADWIAVAGAVDGKLAFFLVRTDQPGVVVGSRVGTLGYNGLAAAPVDLTGVKVAAEYVIGPFDNDDALKYLTMLQDLTLTAASLGVMHRCHNAANAYARSHHRGAKPIFAHQEVRFRLADSFMLLQTSQLMLYRAAWFMGQGDKEGPVLVNCAKVFSAEAAEKVASLGLQIWAGRGYLAGNAVERGFRESKYAGIAGTTTEVSRMSIADEMLGRYK
jgi:isovaleryl-CoA dehydrogenase